MKSDCRQKVTCATCGGSHHTLLHRSPGRSDNDDTPASSTPANEESYRGPQHPDHGTPDEEPFDIVTGTGKVLYIENRQPVSRAIDQIEDIKVVFEF